MKNTTAMRSVYTITIPVSLILMVLFLSSYFREGNPLADPILDITTESKQNGYIIDKENLLPETITQDIEPGQYFITGTVTIPPDTNVRIAENARIYADTDARILVRGNLSANSVVFKSNNLVPNKKIWHGIMIQQEGNVSLSGSTILHATAGISCAGTGDIINTIFSYNTVGIVLLPDGTCEIRGGKIEYGRVGIQSLHPNPVAKDITFRAVEDEIRIYPE